MVFTLSPSQVTSAKPLRYYDKKVTVKKDSKDPKILLKSLMNSLIDTRLCCRIAIQMYMSVLVGQVT
jgi:hypothetical protein